MSSRQEIPSTVCSCYISDRDVSVLKVYVTFLGDGSIDAEEYEYVISHFNVSAAAAHKAFVLFSEVI